MSAGSPNLPARAELAAPRAADLPPLELALVLTTSANLAVLPWANGGMTATGQVVSFGLAVASLALALAGRGRAGGRELVRWPPCWAAVALLAYIATQALNPAWMYVATPTKWRLEPLPHLAWLPSGVRAPFDRMNAWRFGMILATVALHAAALRVGFTRRKSYRLVFATLSSNALLLALLVIAERFSATDKIYWSFSPANAAFLGSFIYPNHGGAYFNLMVAIAAAQAWWYYQQARHRLEAPEQSGALVLAAIFSGLSVLFSYSRMSIFMLLTYFVFLGITFASWQFSRRQRSAHARDSLPLALAACGIVLAGLVVIGLPRIWQRLAPSLAHPVELMRDRTLLRAAAADMAFAHPVFGWGAGSFRYGFPLYAQHHPEIYHSPTGTLFYWEHAHDDLLEFPIEFGAIGLLPFLVMAAWAVAELWRQRAWAHPFAPFALFGALLTVAHASVDFVFQNPAVLLTWATLVLGALSWAEKDRARQVRKAAAAIPAAARPARGVA